MYVTYSLFLTIRGISQVCKCEINLAKEEECDATKLKQKLDQERESIGATLQQQADRYLQPPRRISSEFLDKLFKDWAREIGEGQFETMLTRDLPVMTNSDLDKLEENGYKEIPQFIPPDISDIEPIIGVLPPLDF
jgi:hypothetical protein